jgi:predicted kinase
LCIRDWVEAGGGVRGGSGGVPDWPVGGDVAGDVDGPGARLPREPSEHVRGAPAEDPEGSAPCGELVRERDEALAHEPQAVPRLRMAGEQALVEHEHGQNDVGVGHGCRERGVVVDAQVAAEPGDGGSGHASSSHGRPIRTASSGSMGVATEIQLPDPCLVVLVGAAGAGKSTFAARHFAPEEVLSSDTYRGYVGGDPEDQRATRSAFVALHRAAGSRLARGRLAVIDATSVRPAARSALLRLAAAAGVPAIAIVLDLPPDLVLGRNRLRTAGVVPEDVVVRQLDDLRRSIDGGLLAAEAWLVVARFTDPAAVDAVRVVRRPRAG